MHSRLRSIGVLGVEAQYSLRHFGMCLGCHIHPLAHAQRPRDNQRAGPGSSPHVGQHLRTDWAFPPRARQPPGVTGTGVASSGGTAAAVLASVGYGGGFRASLPMAGELRWVTTWTGGQGEHIAWYSQEVLLLHRTVG